MHPNRRLLIRFSDIGDWPILFAIFQQYGSDRYMGEVLWVVTNMIFQMYVGGGLQLFLDNKTE